MFVYDKTDDSELRSARLQIRHVLFIDNNFTADYQTTAGLRRILDTDGNLDDIDAFLDERNLPLNEIGRRALAERIMVEQPQVGCLTISNALQWRLQYGRAIVLAADLASPGVEELNAKQ